MTPMHGVTCRTTRDASGRAPRRPPCWAALAGAAVCWSAAAAANDLHAQALAHGYRAVTTGAAASAGSVDPTAPTVYVKVVEPRRQAAVLSMAAHPAVAGARYSVATYEIDCALAAVKYSTVQLLDAQWHPAPAGLPLPKTVWHRPDPDSASAMALRLGCG